MLSKTSVLRILLAVGALLLSLSCGRKGPVVVLKNASTLDVKDLTIEGRGFRQRVALLKPGETRAFEVHPSGDTGLAVSFVAGGRLVTQPEAGYFEASPQYTVLVEIQPDLSVTIDATIDEKDYLLNRPR